MLFRLSNLSILIDYEVNQFYYAFLLIFKATQSCFLLQILLIGKLIASQLFKLTELLDYLILLDNGEIIFWSVQYSCEILDSTVIKFLILIIRIFAFR